MTEALRAASNARVGVGLRATACLAALAMVSGACSFGRDSALRPMRIEVIEGRATIVREGRSEVIASGSAVKPGDEIKLSSGGVAELRLARGRVFEIENALIRVASNSGLVLLRGDLLADITQPAKVDAEGAVVTASNGAFRVDRALATRVGSYTGNVEVAGDADRLKVPRLRQAVVAGGVLPTTSKPLRLDAGDRWDRRYLQEALDLDQRLTNFGRGLEAQLGPGSGLAFFQRVLPIGFNFEILAPFVSARRSDVLIGVSLASEAESKGPVQQVFPSMYDLWQQGASWGLIGYEYGVQEQGLFGRLLEAVERAGIRVINGRGPGLRFAPSPQPTNGGQPSPSPTQTGGPGPGPSPSPSPSPTRLDTPVDIPTVAPGPQDTVERTLCGLVGTVCE